ncbi:hypothetical protein MNAN1_003035 [Malassezia nana]|uniref:Queuosine 5'-phosphate N-glycosylase/hydrolase n=1 Tax=Malassezia nana TaxID=180528 RepID=A0AAF0J3H9_9BASI|nr:hypothetical protein MNAN1_003035 [Malassezia nana]
MALDKVRAACADVADAAGIVIDRDAIHAFLQTLKKQDFDKHKTEHGLRFPLTFASFEDEVNWISVLALLNAFSGYRIPFHEATGHGAYDNVRRMVLGLYLSDDAGLSAASLAQMTSAQLAQILGVPTHTETRHPTLPFVTVGTRGGPLDEPLELAATVCRETGAFLQQRHLPNLGAYVLEACEAAAAAEDADEAWIAAIRKVSGFDDAFTDHGQCVFLGKKAYFLLHALRSMLQRPDLPPALSHLRAYYETHKPAPLPMFVDNVVPTMLMAHHILSFAGSAEPALRAWQAVPQTGTAAVEGPCLSRETAYRVRAAALAAGAQIVNMAHTLAQTSPDKAFGAYRG